MLVNIDKVIEAVREHYAQRSQKIDEAIKDNEKAIKALTRLETAEIKDMETIYNFKELTTRLGLLKS